jgi:hypothetical protein
MDEFDDNDNDDLHHLSLEAVEPGPSPDGIEEVRFRTNDGIIRCLHHPAEGDAAVLWVGGAHGGFDGPAGGIYGRLGARLVPSGISSMRLHYRYPNDLIDCVLDALMVTAWLESRGRSRIALVGHAFGGAVVISAGAESESIVAVATLCSQTFGTDAVGLLAPRPLLLLHGAADAVLPDGCSRNIYDRADDPKTIRIYPGCGHELDECRDEVDRDLGAWLLEQLVSA